MNFRSFYRYVFLVLISVFVFTGCGSDNSGGEFVVAPEEENIAPVAKVVNLKTNTGLSISGVFDIEDNEDKYFHYFIVNQPTNGILQFNDKNFFTYTPKLDFIGQDSFTYKVYDGQKYSNIAKVIIDVNKTILNLADTVAPSATTILSLNTLSGSSLSLFWLTSNDDATQTKDLVYEVHCGKEANFTTSVNTKKQSFKGEIEATINGLDENTLYYVKIKTIDSGGNSSISPEMNITTTNNSKLVLNSNNNIKTANDLFLHNGVVDDNSITYIKNDKTKKPNIGDVFISNSNSKVLRKVVSVIDNDKEIKIETEFTTMSEVFSDLELENKTVLYDPNKISTDNNTSLQKIKIYSYNQPTKQGYKWGSGNFEIVQSLDSIESLEDDINESYQKISVVSDYINISSPSNDKITVVSGEALNIKLLAELNEGSKSSFDTDDIARTLLNFKLVSVELDGKTDGNNYGFTFSANRLGNKEEGELKFIASDKRANTKPYIIKLKAEAIWVDKTGFDSAETADKEIELEVTVLTKKIDSSEGFRLTLDDDGEKTKYSFPLLPDFTLNNKDKHKYAVHATAGVDIDFTPTLVTKLDIDQKYIKILLGGQMQLKLDSSFNISGELKKTYDFELTGLNKKFINVYSAGPVPIYQEIDVKWKMQITPNTKGSIDVSNEMTKNFNVNIGVECKGTECKNLSSKNESATYTASIKIGAEASLEVRLIPEVTVSFYRTASTSLSMEPWAKATIKAEGEANFLSDFTNYEKWLSYNLVDLNARAGLDSYISANFKILGWELLKYPSDKEKEKLFGIDVDIFSLPTLGINQLHVDRFIKDSPIELKAQTADGTRTDVNFKSIKWYVYPSDGASIEIDEIDGTKATLKINKFAQYKIYFVANSNQLTSTFGQQRVEMSIDMRDNDGDEMADRWEESNGLNPIDGSEGKADNDNDGYSNLLEYKNGTKPNDKEDYPIGINPDIPNPLLDAPINLTGTSSNNEISLTWDMVSNATEYQICMAEESIINPVNCSSYIGGKIIDVPDNNNTIKNLVKDKTYYFTVQGVASGYDGVWSDELNIIVKDLTIPEDAKEVNLCANQTAFLNKDYTLDMELNNESTTGSVFFKAEDFTGAVFCGEFASATSSKDVLDILETSFSDATNIGLKNKSDGSVKAQYEMIGENVQAFSLLKTILGQAGVSDFSNYLDYSSHAAVKDVYIDLYINYVNSKTVYVILAVTDKADDNSDELNNLVTGDVIDDTQTVKQSKTDTFTYSANTLKTDILFVMDDSGSMSGEQNSASEAIINTFGTAMSSKGIDWKATVIGTGFGHYYSRQYLNTPVLNDITTLASQLKIGTRGSANEEGLRNAYGYLKNGDISIRNNSKLSIVYISDEIEHTSLAELDVSDIKNSYFVKNNIKVNVIIPLTGSYERSSSTRANDLAHKMAEATNGEVINLRNYETGYNTMMTKIADDSAGSASQIVLSEKPTVATIVVKVAGKKIDSSEWNYNPSNQSIVFIALATPKVGDKIEIIYDY